MKTTYPTVSTSKDTQINAAFRKIHKALHAGAGRFALTTELGTENLTMELAYNQLPCYVYQGLTFIQQNPNTKSAYAKAAREGRKITWVQNDKKQYVGLMVDDKIVNYIKPNGIINWKDQ